jgi:hypothetical protein
MIHVTKMSDPLYYIDNKSIIFLLPSFLKFGKIKKIQCGKQNAKKESHGFEQQSLSS